MKIRALVIVKNILATMFMKDLLGTPDTLVMGDVAIGILSYERQPNKEEIENGIREIKDFNEKNGREIVFLDILDNPCPECFREFDTSVNAVTNGERVVQIATVLIDQGYAVETDDNKMITKVDRPEPSLN